MTITTLVYAALAVVVLGAIGCAVALAVCPDKHTDLIDRITDYIVYAVSCAVVIAVPAVSLYLAGADA